MLASVSAAAMKPSSLRRVARDTMLPKPIPGNMYAVSTQPAACTTHALDLVIGWPHIFEYACLLQLMGELLITDRQGAVFMRSGMTLALHGQYVGNWM